MYPQKVIKCLKLLVEKIIYLPNEEIEEYLNDERLKNNSHIKSDYDDLVRILFVRIHIMVNLSMNDQCSKPRNPASQMPSFSPNYSRITNS